MATASCDAVACAEHEVMTVILPCDNSSESRTWSKMRSSQGVAGVKGGVRPQVFQMGSVRPTSW